MINLNVISIRVPDRVLVSAQKSIERLSKQRKTKVSLSMFALEAIRLGCTGELGDLSTELGAGQDRISTQITNEDKENMANAANDVGFSRPMKWAACAVNAYCEQVLMLSPSDSSDLQGLDAYYDKDAMQEHGLSYRRGQHSLARSTFEHLEGGLIGLCEAGTGTGKAYACLTAAASFAQDKKTPVVVATYTRALQKQLHETSLILNKVSCGNARVAVVYGKSNYASPSLVNEMIHDKDTAKEAVAILKSWSKKTQTWLLADLAELVDQDFPIELLAVSADTQDDLELAAYRQSIERASEADVVITSHQMLIYAMMMKKANILGFYPDHIVIDEAHMFESAADTVLGKQVALSVVTWGLNRLIEIKGRHQKNMIEWKSNLKAFSQMVVSKSDGADVLELTSRNGISAAARGAKPFIDSLAVAPKVTKEALKKMSSIERAAYDSIVEAAALFADLKKSVAATVPQYGNAHATLSPVLKNVRLLSSSSSFIAKDIERIVWDKIRGASLLSATLLLPTKGETDSAQFFINSIGLKDKDIIVEQPIFESWVYENLTIYAADKDHPVPTSSEVEGNIERESWLDSVVKTIEDVDKKPVSETHGGIMVLCTSYADAHAIEAKLKLKNRKLITYRRNDDMRQMISSFKKLNGKGVIIGLGGFWTGVDLPGNLLTDLVITRLPIMSASDKSVISRYEYIKKNIGGGQAFAQVLLPKMAMVLRQGIGRVIRTHNDHGRVYITDPRVVTKPNWRVTNILRKYEPILNLSIKGVK